MFFHSHVLHMHSYPIFPKYIYKSCVPKEGPREGLSIISFEGFALYYAGVGQNSQHMLQMKSNELPHDLAIGFLVCEL